MTEKLQLSPAAKFAPLTTKITEEALVDVVVKVEPVPQVLVAGNVLMVVPSMIDDISWVKPILVAELAASVLVKVKVWVKLFPPAMTLLSKTAEILGANLTLKLFDTAGDVVAESLVKFMVLVVLV